MENKIKVTVEYEVPTTSKINALLKEYKAAAKLAAETQRELTPIIKETGLAKHMAIMKQLKPIMDGMKELSYLKSTLDNNNSCVNLSVNYRHPGVDERKFIIKYMRGCGNDQFSIRYCVSRHSYDSGDDFMDVLSDKYGTMFGTDKGIVTYWNQLGIIDKLNEALEDTIRYEVSTAINIKKATEKQLNNLINN